MSNENKSTSHPHSKLIHAWAEGEKIQSRVLLDFDNVEQWSKWTDDDEPEWWNEDYQFRVKPKKPSNEPWTPEFGVEYYYIHIDSYGIVLPRSCLWTGNEIDHRFWEFGNCFRTIKEAEAAIPRVKDTLKEYFAKDVNVPINVGSPKIDGITLTGGEIALIKALRNTNVYKVYEGDSLLVFNDEDDGLQVDGAVIAFNCAGHGNEIRACLKKIKDKQKENNDFN